MITMTFLIRIFGEMMAMIERRSLEKEIHLFLMIGEIFGTVLVFALIGFFVTCAAGIKTMARALLQDILVILI